MPETEIQAPDAVPELDIPDAPQQEKPKGKLVSAGKPVLIKNTSQQTPQLAGATPIPQEVANKPNEKPSNNADANATTATNGVDAKGGTPAPAFSEEQLSAYFESQGIKFEGIDKLREKMNPPERVTPEQKAAQAAAHEKKLVDLFVQGGGTVEQYVAIKGVAEADISELSLNSTKAELKAAGFTAEQVDEIIRERYYQISDEELEQYDDETDKEFFKRKKEYGANKLANRSSHTKKQAQDILANLEQAAQSEDLQKAEELTLASKIDEQFKTLPRKFNLNIGEQNGKAIPPIEYEVSEADIAEVRAMLKDPDQRNNFFFNKEGGYNLENITSVLTRNKYLESAVKAAYHEGGSRQVAEFQKTFPARTPQELGVGGSPKPPTGQKGKLVSWSKPQVLNRPQQHNR